LNALSEKRYNEEDIKRGLKGLLLGLFHTIIGEIGCYNNKRKEWNPGKQPSQSILPEAVM
jgi:hypothetical protein